MTCDRVGFLQSINTSGKSYSDTILNSFDQLMGLYNISNAKYDITVIKSCDKLLVLSMDFYDEYVTESVYGIISSNNAMNIYGRKFNIEAQKINPIRIDLYMTEV